MKKIILYILFLLTGITVFANKGTYDETKFRQSVINYAMNNLGVPYNQNRRMQNGFFDCSSYVGRAVRSAGMAGGVNGNEGSWATTTDGMRGNVKNVSFDQIKPGDTLNFSKDPYCCGHVVIVLENLGGGKFKIAHAGSPTKVQTINARTWRKGTYIGSISATQMLINNGYTPVNSSGQVVVPPAGTAVAGSGSETSVENTTHVQYKPSKEINWDAFADNFMGFIKTGLKSLGNIFIFFMTIFYMIQVMNDSIIALADNNIKGFISGTIFKRTFGFVFYLFITNKIFSGELVEMGKDISYGILEKLTGEKVHSLNYVWSLKESLASAVFDAMNGIDWLNVWDVQKNLVISIVLLIIFVLINLAFFFIMFDLFKLLIGFELSLGLSPVFLPLGILDGLRQYYNVGKVFSMIINFIVKLVSINFFVIVGIKVLRENNTFTNLADSLRDINTILAGDFVLYIFLVFIVYSIIHKIEISF